MAFSLTYANLEIAPTLPLHLPGLYSGPLRLLQEHRLMEVSTLWAHTRPSPLS